MFRDIITTQAAAAIARAGPKMAQEAVEEMAQQLADAIAENLGSDYYVRSWFKGRRGWFVVHKDLYAAVFEYVEP
jgi:predicted secreted protein